MPLRPGDIIKFMLNYVPMDLSVLGVANVNCYSFVSASNNISMGDHALMIAYVPINVTGWDLDMQQIHHKHGMQGLNVIMTDDGHVCLIFDHDIRQRDPPYVVVHKNKKQEKRVRLYMIKRILIAALVFISLLSCKTTEQIERLCSDTFTGVSVCDCILIKASDTENSAVTKLAAYTCLKKHHAAALKIIKDNKLDVLLAEKKE